MNKARIPYILCCGAHGRAVVYGYVDSKPVPGEPVTLYDARMVLSWAEECGGLFGLAARGPRGNPERGTRITHAVPETTETVWQESLAVSPDAARELDQWPAV